MPKLNFDQVVDSILEKDSRYDAKAYTFVREGLDFTLKKGKRRGHAPNRHVSGTELLEGLREFTVREFGPMGKMVLNEWGVSSCEDFGAIVFNLVQTGIFGKSETDRLEDFAGVYTFDDAFVKPFLPAKAKPVRRQQSGKPRTRAKNSAPAKGVSES